MNRCGKMFSAIALWCLANTVFAQVDWPALLAADNVEALAPLMGAREGQMPINGRDGVVPLVIAAQRNAVQTVTWLLQQGADVDVRSASGSTALAMAAYYGHLDAMARLIDANADLDARSPNGYQALDWAFENQKMDAAKLLLMAWAKRHAASTSERQLIDAIARGAALSHDKKAAYTSFPLLLAIANNSEQATEWLLQQGFDPNQQNAAGYAPLPFAARLGNEALVALLLRFKADPNLGGKRGHDVAGALNQAARGGQVNVARQLLLAGADVNRGNAKGITALYICAVNDKDSGDFTQLLLEHGALVRQRADDGYDALDVAHENRNRMATKLMLQHLFEQSLNDAALIKQVNAFVSDATQPLPPISDESAALWLNALIVAGNKPNFNRVLDQLSSSPLNIKNGSGHFPLSVAASWGEYDMLVRLLQRGASVNQHNDNRYNTTALMESTRDGQVAIARELLTKGAEINALDKHQDNALNWAVYFGQQPLVQLLLEHEANFNQVGQQTQDNALDIAKRQRFAEIVALLEKAGAKATK